MGFFSDVSKKASETYKATAEKTNKFTKEMKLKSYINNDKDKIDEIYKEIGKKVYEKHIREENIDIKNELTEECNKIDAYAKEIEDIENEIRALKDLRLCKVCAAEININAKFCPMCGANQNNQENQSEEPKQGNMVIQMPEQTQSEEQVQSVEDNKNNEQAQYCEANQYDEYVNNNETFED